VTDREQGYERGKKWALEEADEREIRYLHENRTFIYAEGYLEKECPADEKIVFDLTLRRGAVEVVNFWTRVNGEGEGSATNEYVQGFAEGAIEAR